MPCLCFKKKPKDKRKKRGADGIKNLAYNNADGDDDDDNLDNNAVLKEIELTENAEASKKEEPTTVPEETTPKASSPTGTKTANKIQVEAQITNHVSQTVPSQSRCAVKTQNTASQDDLYLSDGQLEVREVDLISKDSVGLGVSLTGTVSDGIIISNLNDKGPAYHSGQVNIGDRILSVTISFDNMVYEDALTILSYASPYPVTLRLVRKDKSDNPGSETAQPPTKQNKVYHPVYRSQSTGGNLYKHKKQKLHPPRPGTSLSQLDYPIHADNKAGSDDSLDGVLVKDKFGNTLNLMGSSDTSLHRLKDNDTNSRSTRSSSEHHSSSDSISDSNTVQEGKTTPLSNSAAEERNTTDSINMNVSLKPPEKPKRTYSPVYESPKQDVPTTFVSLVNGNQPSTDSDLADTSPEAELQADIEAEITLTKIEKTETVLNSLEGDPVERTQKLDKAEIKQLLKSQQLLVEDAIVVENNLEVKTPVNEEIIQPSVKTKEESLPQNIEIIIDNAYTPPSRYEDARITPIEQDIDLSMPPEADDTSYIRSVSYTRSDSSSDTAALTSTDSDTTLVNLNTKHILRAESLPTSDSEATLTGIIMPEEIEDYRDNGEQLHTPPGSSRSSTPPANEQETQNYQSQYHREESDNEGLTLSSNLGTDQLEAISKLDEQKTSLSVDTVDSTSSNLSSPRFSWIGSTTTSTQKNSTDLFQASSRSQLEAARARFFAELMQSSDLFKDSPNQPFKLSSESLNSTDRQNNNTTNNQISYSNMYSS